MWTFVLKCRPNVDLFEQKGPHVDLWRKMWTYLATLHNKRIIICKEKIYGFDYEITRLSIMEAVVYF